MSDTTEALIAYARGCDIRNDPLVVDLVDALEAQQARINAGDYHEGFEEGIAVGRAQAITAAVEAASRPAGNGLMEYADRVSIIVSRIRALSGGVSDTEQPNQQIRDGSES